MKPNNVPQGQPEATAPARKSGESYRLNEIEKGQLATDAIRCFNLVSGSLSDLPGLISKIIREKVWERRIHNGRLIELPNLRALITEPFPRGWSEQPDKIEAIIKSDVESLALFREAMVEGPGGSGSNQYEIKESAINDNIINTLSSQGTSKAYTVSRLKRDRPDLFEKVVAGELSANRAAIEAGFRRRARTMSENLDYLWAKATPDEQTGFLARIMAPSSLVVGGDDVTN
jgi:hypothetical protein